MLVGSFTFSSNESLKMTPKLDCYEFAFDAMEAAEEAGLSAALISLHGEMAYCACADNCSIE